MNNIKKSLEEHSKRMHKFNSEQIALHENNKTKEDLNGSVNEMNVSKKLALEDFYIDNIDDFHLSGHLKVNYMGDTHLIELNSLYDIETALDKFMYILNEIKEKSGQ